jgi:hypothetical protein
MPDVLSWWQSMNGTSIALVQPLAYRQWDPKHKSFFYTDVQPKEPQFLDRWTGLFDKQGLALYENDIIRVHYDWKLGWVSALVMREGKGERYCAQCTTSDGKVLQIGFYCFTDAYRLGNVREHPGKLVAAREQFPEPESQSWWLRSAFRHSTPPWCFN